MLIIITTADSIKKTLVELKESFIFRFVFLRSVLHSEALTDAKMLEIYQYYQEIENTWFNYIKDPRLVEDSRSTTFGYLRGLLEQVRAFEVVVHKELISLPQLTRDQRTDVYYKCLGTLKLIDETFDDLDDIESRRISLFSQEASE